MMRVPNSRTVYRLAWRGLKADKWRNLFAILAIVLTCILVTSVLTMGISLLDAARYTLMKASGQKAEVSFEYLTAEERDRVIAHPLIKQYGSSQLVSISSEGEWETLPLEIRTTDENFAALTFSTPSVGRLPESPREVAVKSFMLTHLGLEVSLGQEITLSFPVGDTVHHLDLTVCGIFEDDQTLHPFGTAYVAQSLADTLLTDVDPAVGRTVGVYDGVIQVYANLNGRMSELSDNLDAIVADTGLDPTLTVPWVGGAYEVTSLSGQALFGLLLVVLMVLFSGHLLIYNIFYIAVVKQIKYYGLLKTIGTTTRQIKRIVTLQGCVLYVVALPFGLLLGYGIAVVLLPLLLAMTTFSVEAKAAANPMMFVLAAGLSLGTVLLSCRYPARIAGKISPVEATKYTGTLVKHDPKPKRGSNGARLSRMAFTNLFRQKRKTIVTLLSVSLGLILCNLVFTLMNSFDVNKVVEWYLYGDFVIADQSYFTAASIYTPQQTLDEELVAELTALEGVETVASLHYADDSEPGGLSRQLYGMDEFWYDKNGKNLLEQHIVSGKWDQQRFQSGEAVVLGDLPGCPFGVGDRITLSNGASYDVMAQVDTTALYALSAHFFLDVIVYLPAETLKEHSSAELMSLSIFSPDADLERLSQQIDDILLESPRLEKQSQVDYRHAMRQQNAQFSMVGMALGVLVLLIGVLNFVNSTMTNVLSRKHEFALLQAIGMTTRQSKQLLMLEGIYFALLCGGIFVSAGYLLSYAVVRLLSAGDTAYTYQFTVLPLLLSLPLIGVIATLLPRLCYQRICCDSVVERLRED